MECPKLALPPPTCARARVFITWQSSDSFNSLSVIAVLIYNRPFMFSETRITTTRHTSYCTRVYLSSVEGVLRSEIKYSVAGNVSGVRNRHSGNNTKLVEGKVNPFTGFYVRRNQTTWNMSRLMWYVIPIFTSPTDDTRYSLDTESVGSRHMDSNPRRPLWNYCVDDWATPTTWYVRTVLSLTYRNEEHRQVKEERNWTEHTLFIR